jgi:hypothetical protein
MVSSGDRIFHMLCWQLAFISYLDTCALFLDRECFTLVQPVNNEKDLQRLDQLPVSISSFELQLLFVALYLKFLANIICCMLDSNFS